MRSIKGLLTVFFSVGIIAVLITFASLYGIINLNMFKSDDVIIENRIDKFLKNYNSGDYDGVLDCLDLKTKNTYKSVSNIGNAIIGKTGFKISLADLFGISVGVLSSDDLLKVSDMNINIISENNAEVKAVLSYKNDAASAFNSTINVCFVMVKENNDWFIKDLK